MVFLDNAFVQGSSTPWRLNQNYLRDLLALRFGTLQDGVLQFSKPPRFSDGAQHPQS